MSTARGRNIWEKPVPRETASPRPDSAERRIFGGSRRDGSCRRSPPRGPNGDVRRHFVFFFLWLFRREKRSECGGDDPKDFFILRIITGRKRIQYQLLHLLLLPDQIDMVVSFVWRWS